MSFQASLAKLSSPLKALVTGAIQLENGSGDTGKSDKDKADVIEWIDKVAQGDIVKLSGIKNLDVQLISRTYIVNNYLTAADIALYGALHPIISKLEPRDYYSHPALTRYFDHIQYRPTVRKSADVLSPPLPLVKFDLDNAPKIERKAEPTKKKERATKPADCAQPGDIKAPSADGSAKEGGSKSQKKEKNVDGMPAQDGGKKRTGGPGKGTTPVEDAEPVPSMIDLRVGHIVDIKKHPDADGLYIEQIDIGEETGPRTVVSGLVHYIPIEEMRDKYLVAVCNLKPANMRGVKSFAMVLCATSKDGKEAGIEVIQPPPNSKPGDRIYFDGAGFENAMPLSQLNPKKKIFETIQPGKLFVHSFLLGLNGSDTIFTGFITLDSREAAWIDPTTKSVHKIRTKEGVCVAPTLVGASLS